MQGKQLSLWIALAVIAALFVATTQALAGPAPAAAAKNTPAAPGTPPGKPTGQPGKGHGKPEHYKGVIAAADDSSLMLTLADGTPVSFVITADTRIKAPGLHGETGATLQVGLQAMVQAERDENSVLTARSIMVIPGKPVRAHRVGWVTEYAPGVSITIQASDGNFYTFVLSAETKILPADRAGELAVGSRVTIISPRAPASLGWNAQGIVVHPAGSGAGSAPPTGTPSPTP